MMELVPRPKLKGSTRKQNGGKESPHVTTRGVVTVGLIFRLKKKEREIISNIQEWIKIVTGNSWEQTDPPQSVKIEESDIFFQTEFPDSEYAGNDRFLDYLKNVINLLEDHPAKQQLKELKHELTKLKPRSVTSIETVFDVHSTL